MISSNIIETNIAIEVFASALCLVFIICITIAGDLKQKLNRIFLGVMLSNIAVMLSDALAFSSIGKPGIYYLIFNYIGNICTYLFSYVLIMTFSNYLITYLSTKIDVKRTALYAVYGVCGLAILLTFVALLNGMYFYIDENNIYHRRDWYWLSQMLGIVGLLINMGIIVQHRKYFNSIESFVLSSYIILPVIAVIIQMLVYGLVSVYIASTITIVMIYVGLQSEMNKRLKEKELELSESRVAIMLSQIKPHFLYNSLSSIAMLSDENPRAKQLIIDFAVYLRGNMDYLSETKLISFEQELRHIKVYLNLEKARFGDELTVVYDIKEKDFSLPSLTVQPILENAVKYGVGKKEDGGTVILSTAKTENSYIITVSDDGVGFDPEETRNDNRTHMGIDNVRSRLKAQCGGTLDIKSKIGVGTTATIRVPKQKE